VDNAYLDVGDAVSESFLALVSLKTLDCSTSLVLNERLLSFEDIEDSLG
jgi:hypothetical protein